MQKSARNMLLAAGLEGTEKTPIKIDSYGARGVASRVADLEYPADLQSFMDIRTNAWLFINDGCGKIKFRGLARRPGKPSFSGGHTVAKARY
jgi:hypothetical protein